MKSLKLLLSVCALAAVAASPVLRADDEPSTPPPGAPEHKMPNGERLKEAVAKLALTDDQKAKIKPILEDAAKALKALKEDTTLDKKERRQKAMEITKTHLEQILPILTPDQQAKLKAALQQHRKAPDAPPPAPAPAS